MSLSKSFDGKSSENGSSNSSNGGGSGNNSDNSALVSLGNTSFGFNFDSEEGNSPHNSNNSEEGDSDGSNHGGAGGKPKTSQTAKQQESKAVSARSSTPKIGSTSAASHSIAAANAVASLQSIANKSTAKLPEDGRSFSCPYRMLFK